jgi:HEAT repeat protein
MQVKYRRGHQQPHRGKTDASPLHEETLLAEKMRRGTAQEKLETIIDICYDNAGLNRRDARTILARALDDEDLTVRWSAAYGLGLMDALVELNEGLNKPCPHVQSMSAAMIYASLRRTDVMDTEFQPIELMEGLARSLAANLGSDNASVARHSISALSEIAWRAPVAAITIVDEEKANLGDGNELDERLKIVEKVATQSLEMAGSRNRA